MENTNIFNQQLLNQLGRQLGYSNAIPAQYVDLATSLLMSGLANNMNQPNGANALLNALNNDHVAGSSNLLGNLVNLLPGLMGNQRNSGILNHVLGNNLDPIVTAFSRATGIPKDRAKQLLVLFAPFIFAYFDKQMQ